MTGGALRVVDSETPGNALRIPPHNYEAERALLGAIMMNNRAFERVSDFLMPEHFADPVNGRLYQLTCELIAQGRQANPVTLRSYVQNDDVLKEPGVKYLATLAAGAVTVINAAEYGRLVYDLFLRRELIDLGESIVNKAFDATPDESAVAQIEEAETSLFNLAEGGAIEGGLEDLDVALDGAMQQAEAAHRRDGELVGLTTGLRDLDDKLAGLHPSDLIILAGRPSMGKTALATRICWSAAEYLKAPKRPEDRGKSVALFSLEMSKAQIGARMLAERAGLNNHSIRAGRLANEDFAKLMQARRDLAGLPLKIDDTPASTVGAIRTRARRLARKKQADAESGLGLIVIDYLQLISAQGRERPENRVQEISAMTRGLKALAKELNVPVIALSQLSRAVENREDKRPQLADLRESGTIEQDSDVVMFVYREQYYLERAEPSRRADESQEHFSDRHTKWHHRLGEVHNVAEIIVGKNRHGPIATVKAQFDGATTAFSDLETVHAPESVSRESGAGGPPPGHPAAEQFSMTWEDER